MYIQQKPQALNAFIIIHAWITFLFSIAEASSELQEYSSLLSQLSLVLANDYSDKHDELCSLLTQLWKAYHNQSSSDVKHGLADYAASTSAVKELCHCICNIIKSEPYQLKGPTFMCCTK